MFTVRLNLQEQEIAKELMILFNVKSPITALKMAARIGLNVLHTTFGADLMKRLFKKDRVFLEDYEDPELVMRKRL